MTRRPTAALVAASLCAVFVLAACGAGSGGSSPSPTAAAAGGATTVSLASSSAGDHLSGPNGHALYLFAPDSANTSTCTDTCAKNWPPLRVSAGQNPVAGSGLSIQLGQSCHVRVPELMGDGVLPGRDPLWRPSSSRTCRCTCLCSALLQARRGRAHDRQLRRGDPQPTSWPARQWSRHRQQQPPHFIDHSEPAPHARSTGTAHRDAATRAAVGRRDSDHLLCGGVRLVFPDSNYGT